MGKNSFKIELIEESLCLFFTLIDSQDWNSHKAKNENDQEDLRERVILEKVSTLHFVLI